MLQDLRNWRARLIAGLVDRLDLVLENLALQHQLRVYQRGRRLQGSDRLCWCLLSRFWPMWRESLKVVRPATVLRWRRTRWWRHLGHGHRLGGRPPIDPELQVLIQRVAAENRLWGSMRIVGVLRILGFRVSNSTVRRYRGASPRPLSKQGWAAFLHNHAPYVREAVREELGDRTRRLLETLRGSSSQGARIVGSASGEWPTERPCEYVELIEERRGEWLCRCSVCEGARHTARDPPDVRRNAA